MTSPGGHWIRVRFADARSRLDWIPDQQPPAPGGTPGRWHVVPDTAGGESRWEWHARSLDGPRVMPHQPARSAAPSVLPQARRAADSGEARATAAPPAPLPAPVRLRWAAWSLSLVLAIPMVYLLTHRSPTDTGSNNTDPGASQSDLAGLSPNSDESAMAAGDQAPPSSAEPDGAAIGRYLAHLYHLDTTQGYSFAALGNASLVSSGSSACGALDRGDAYDGVRQSVLNQIPNGGQIVVAAAATFLCPQHHDKLQAYAAPQSGSSSATASDTSSATWADTASEPAGSDVAAG